MEPLTHRLSNLGSDLKIYVLVLAAAVLAGVGTGYYLALSKAPNSTKSVASLNSATTQAQQNSVSLRDFADGVIAKKPSPKPNGEYGEGAYLLIRQSGTPVALTSSVVDLSQYEGKKVRVFGETQRALKEGWLIDVGKVEVQ